MKPDELDDDEWSALLEGLALAEYSLVLGAGASLGATNGLGTSLLSGAGLRDKLLEHYGIPGGQDRGLRQVYDLAQQISATQSDVAPKDLIAPWFSGCKVPEWYGKLVTLPWRVIWNLNIDDVLANAYQHRFRDRARQTLRVMSWRDRWTSTREPLDRVSAIHLHGDAKTRDMIFGSLEYLSAAREGGSAHRIFWDEWANGSPTIVIGASLEDELDLAAPLLSDLASDRPSVIVKPTFSEFDEFRLRQSGLVPIRMTGEQFFAAVESDWEQALVTLGDHVPGALGMNPMAISFLRSFRQPLSRRDRWHDFYAGDEPTWSDLDDDLDARRALRNAPDAASPFSAKGLCVHAFHGELSGTTTAEMRFLKDAVSAGFAVLEYEGDGKFDPRSIHWMAKQGSRKLLRIARLEDFGDTAAELESLCSESGTPVVLVTSLRTSRLERLRFHLGDALWAVRVPDRLSNEEINTLLATLDTNHRLNTVLELDGPEREEFVRVKHHRSLVDSMAAITRGSSFAARYEEAYRDVADPLAQHILDLVLVASEARYELSFGLLARAAQATTAQLRERLEDPLLARLIQRTRAGVSARHWGLAAQASRRVVTAERRFSATIQIALAAAPYVHPTTISQRTREVALCARLMDAQRVVDAFGSQRADELYGALEEAFAWNSRFWEQRALAELEGSTPRWERAEAWAREAVVRHEDGLSLNTLATVLLRRSNWGQELDEELFFEGLAVVDKARQMSLARVTEHPYMTAFHYMRRGRLKATDASLRRRIDEFFNYWRLEVQRSHAWDQPTMRRDLESEIEQYLGSLD